MSDAKSSSATATTGTAEPGRPYRGRFAPSPTGPLHFGSLVAAVGSYLDARTRGGEWLVRIEDLDPPRERPGAADDILRTLERLGLHWDGPVLRQSTRADAYEAALDRLAAAGRPARCCLLARPARPRCRRTCASDPGDELFHPPSACPRSPAAAGDGTACRFRAPDRDVEFVDRVQGLQCANVARTVGDFVLRRRDGLYRLPARRGRRRRGAGRHRRGARRRPARQHARQIVLQQAWGCRGSTYMHLPLAVDDRALSSPSPTMRRRCRGRRPAAPAGRGAGFLRQAPPAGLERASLGEVWQWARRDTGGRGCSRE